MVRLYLVRKFKNEINDIKRDIMENELKYLSVKIDELEDAITEALDDGYTENELKERIKERQTLESIHTILLEVETSEKQALIIGSVRLSFDEIFHFNCWMTKNNWYEACDGEYDNHEKPNKCIRLTFEELYNEYLNEA